MDEGVYYLVEALLKQMAESVARIGELCQTVGGGGSNIEQDWGLSDEWPPVVSNGFTGG